MALATVAELEARIGEPAGSLVGEDLARATAALEDASTVIQTVGRESWTDSEGDNPAPAIAVVVTLRLAKRIYLNPEDNRWEQIGDLTQGKADPTSLLTQEEQALVRQAADVSYSVYTTGTPSAYSGSTFSDTT